MPDDYAKDTAAPSFITIGDRDYRVGKFGPRDLGDLQAFIKSRVPDPRLMARELCAGLPDAVAIEVWRDLSAEASRWPPSYDSREGCEVLMATWEGHAQVVWISLRRHNADFTLERARQLTEHDDELMMKVFILAQPEPTFDPKAPTDSMMNPE